MRRSDVMALGVIVGGAAFGLMATSQLLSARPAGQFDSLRHEARVIRVSAPTVETIVTMVCEDEAAIEVNLDGLNIAMQELRIRLSEVRDMNLDAQFEAERLSVYTEIETQLHEELEQIEEGADTPPSERDAERVAVAEARARSLQVSARQIALNRNQQLAEAIQAQAQAQMRTQIDRIGMVELVTLHSDSDDNRKCKRRRHPPRVRVRVRKIERP